MKAAAFDARESSGSGCQTNSFVDMRWSAWEMALDEVAGTGVYNPDRNAACDLLSRQIILDESADDFVEVCVGTDAVARGSCGDELAGPAVDDGLKVGIRLPSDTAKPAHLAEALQRLDHITDAHRERGQVHRARVAETGRRQIVRGQDRRCDAPCGSNRDARFRRQRAHHVAAQQWLAHDRGDAIGY